jgi:hypothetical protein
MISRRKNVRRKLNAMALEFSGKSVLIVDGKCEVMSAVVVSNRGGQIQSCEELPPRRSSRWPRTSVRGR